MTRATPPGPPTWPPDYGAELARILGYHAADLHRPSRVEPAPILHLQAATAELDAWLTDPRKWDPGHHKRPWLDVVSDLRCALVTRGQDLCKVTPGLDELDSELANLPGDNDGPVRARLRSLSGQAWQELGSPASAVAAFDDLASSVQSGSIPWTVVDSRLLAFDAALLTAGRSPENEADLLADVLRDHRRGIAIARRELDGTPRPDLRDNYDVPAGVPFGQRLELCRRLMAQPSTPGRHVIWLFYGDATLRHWTLPFGPVTFFDGPKLLHVVTIREGDPEGFGHLDIPPELLRANDTSIRSPDEEAWAAARIDLGDETYPDPLRAARDQADALVKLATFGQGGTSWHLLDEYVRYVDGELLGWGSVFGGQARPEFTVHSDSTAAHLEQFQTAVTPHLPVSDPQLHELIEAAAVVAVAEASPDPSALLQEVRIVELIASRCDARWVDFLGDTYALHWARDQILSEIQQVLLESVMDDTLRGSGQFAELATMWPQLASGTSTSTGLSEFNFDYPSALTAIVEYAPRLPTQNITARKMRTVAEHAASPAAIATWVKRLTEDHKRLRDRLLRCRNSLAHGGPINLTVAATVRPFSTRHATYAAAHALRAAIEKTSLRQAFQTRQQRANKWRDSIATAATPHEALFGEPGPEDAPA